MTEFAQCIQRLLSFVESAAAEGDEKRNKNTTADKQTSESKTLVFPVKQTSEKEIEGKQ